METRKITVVESRNQKKTVIETAATTLGELKSELRNKGIEYSGMTFYEGISRTELKDDASILPHDLPYKGATTNNLAIMLTTTNKKIRSGAMSAERAAAYEAIKANNLGDAVKAKFGKNFTQVSTGDLTVFLEAQNAPQKVEAPQSKPSSVEANTKVVEAAKEEAFAPQTPTPVVGKDTKARKAISILLEALYVEDYIDDDTRSGIEELFEEECQEVAVEATAPKAKSSKKSDDAPYSDSELDDMFGSWTK